MKNKVSVLFLVVFMLYGQEKNFFQADSILRDKPLKDPTTSILLSMAMPGMGQFYVESYTKSILFSGTFLFFVAVAVDNNSKLNDIKNNTNPDLSEIDRLVDKRNVAIWRGFAVYLLNILDAYAGAYLFGFDEMMSTNKFGSLKMSDTNISLNFKLNF